jgi:hypothetical protein
MIRLIPAIIIMLYYWLFRIKSYGKLLIYSTKHGCLLCLLAVALQEQNQSTAISNRPLDSSAGCSLAKIPNRLELLN